ncbi:MAG: hypothetical protein ACTIMA_09125 [Brachybacterium tyrofermentans]|uniref:Uncharacterized protein n=1 Tax=Brachybacterium tyrofermentans TaxID=47848 RepID=A0ABW0FH21_9MICO|nr:hypothetical protein [Brachybacterium tyrofermentans]
MTSPAPLAARFSVDSGDSSADESMPQDEVDRGGHGQLTVEVTERATEPQDHSLSVDFGDLLFWISPEVTTDFRLSSLTLLGTSAHIGCGRLSASLASTGSPGAPNGRLDAIEEWTVSIDRDSVTAPPLVEEGYEPLPRTGSWRDGAASVALTIDPDGVVRRIVLRLDRSRLRA